jgi:dUTP pyrophosphatase
MKVRIKRIDKSLPLPVYETGGAVGFDLLAREDTVIQPDEIVLIPANVIVEVPKGYALILASRSSTPKKHGLTKPHGIGVIDRDYCGPEDEIKIQVKSFQSKSVTIPKGTKIAQGLFVKVNRLEFDEVDRIDAPTRGGFGSTDLESSK